MVMRRLRPNMIHRVLEIQSITYGRSRSAKSTTCLDASSAQVQVVRIQSVNCAKPTYWRFISLDVVQMCAKLTLRYLVYNSLCEICQLITL